MQTSSDNGQFQIH